MSATSKARDRERRRCGEIVSEGKARLITVLYGKPGGYPNRMIKESSAIKRFIEILTQLEGAIHEKEPKEAAASEPRYQGDFSIEEMERAMTLIEEQERNPFEEENS